MKTRFVIMLLMVVALASGVACRGRDQLALPAATNTSVLNPPRPTQPPVTLPTARPSVPPTSAQPTPRPTLPPAASLPPAPSNLRVAQVTQTEIAVTWQDNSDNETGFRVYLAGTDVVGRVGPNVTRAVLGNLTCNVQYQYTVRAVNAAGESVPSNAIDVTTAKCP